ncbi:MAG: aspartate aminotransferase family protein [Gemmatimonadales bacterium]|nr:aspartate aminotransferase family protein [Gemmatimonadales bacterium]
MPTTDATAPFVDLPAESFRALGHEAIDLITQFFADINEVAPFPARTPADVRALFDLRLPTAGEDPHTILADWSTKILPNSSVLGSPRWFGFVNGSGNQIGAIADALASALNANLGGWKASPAATEIERRTIAWLSEMIGYAPDAGGLFLSGGTMANMAALRTALRSKATWDLAAEGLQASGARRMTIYMADHETHVSFQGAVDFLGLGQQALRKVPSNADFTIDVAALEAMLDADIAAGMTPFCIVGHGGSINVGAFDDFDALADVAARRNLWFHVDGACGALGAILPELAAHFRGMDRADSVSFDAHKWLGTPYEAACLLVRNPDSLQQAFVTHATYLLSSTPSEYTGFNYFDYGPQLSRGWRALKVWMSLRQYGVDGYQAIFRRTIACAKHLHALVVASDEFEVVQPEPELYIYSFRYAPAALRHDDAALDLLNQRIADEITTRQVAFVMTTRIRGRVTQRLSICSHRTRIKDIDETFEAMRGIGEELR